MKLLFLVSLRSKIAHLFLKWRDESVKNGLLREIIV